MSSSKNLGVLCANDAHKDRLYFCKNCARYKNPVEKVFYCEICNPQIKNSHLTHSMDKIQLGGKDLLNLYEKFKVQLKRWLVNEVKKLNNELSLGEADRKLVQIVNAVQPVFQNVVKQTDFRKNWRAQFQDLNYCEWLLQRRFWESGAQNALQIKKQLQNFLKENMEKKAVQTNPFAFQIFLNKKPSKGSSVDYVKEEIKLEEKVQDLSKQKNIGQLFMRICSYVEDWEMESGLEEIEEAEKEWEKPLPFIFYLAKLKVSELCKEGSKKIEQILNDPSFPKQNNRENEIFHYFSALAQWQQVKDQDVENTGDLIFFEQRNEMYYKLGSSKKYIEALTKAIEVEPRGLYFASRALGHIVDSNYQLAEDDFQAAERSGFKNDAFLNNRNYNCLKRNMETDRSLLKDSLPDLSVRYISNLCKFLQKDKDYKNLKLCCDQLVLREPKNISFKLKQFHAVFKLRDKDSAIQIIGDIKDLNELDQTEMEILERKLEYLKAIEHDKYNKLEEANQEYEHVIEMGNQSSTYLYNYAAFLFKNRDFFDKNTDALININRAIELKPKPHFFKLKYLLLFVSESFEECKRMHPLTWDINDQFKEMRQYVQENCE